MRVNDLPPLSPIIEIYATVLFINPDLLLFRIK